MFGVQWMRKTHFSILKRKQITGHSLFKKAYHKIPKIRTSKYKLPKAV